MLKKIQDWQKGVDTHVRSSYHATQTKSGAPILEDEAINLFSLHLAGFHP